MKNFLMLSMLCVGLFVLDGQTAQAQFGSTGRLDELARQLADQANDAAERSYGDFTNRSTNNRSDTESLFFAQQFGAAANVFRRMVQDNRPQSELRDAMILLDNLSRTVNQNYSARNGWRDSQRTLNDLARELNYTRSYNDPSERRNDFPTDTARITGRMQWKGRVDDNVQLVIRDGEVIVRLISGTPYNNATYNFTSPLPRRRLTVNLNVIKGRGEVKILQQPARDNDFTTIIEIRDPKGGASDYELELTW